MGASVLTRWWVDLNDVNLLLLLLWLLYFTTVYIEAALLCWLCLLEPGITMLKLLSLVLIVNLLILLRLRFMDRRHSLLSLLWLARRTLTEKLRQFALSILVNAVLLFLPLNVHVWDRLGCRWFHFSLWSLRHLLHIQENAFVGATRRRVGSHDRRCWHLLETRRNVTCRVLNRQSVIPGELLVVGLASAAVLLLLCHVNVHFLSCR